jgi:hypothetical protein
MASISKNQSVKITLPLQRQKGENTLYEWLKNWATVNNDKEIFQNGIYGA